MSEITENLAAQKALNERLLAAIQNVANDAKRLDTKISELEGRIVGMTEEERQAFADLRAQSTANVEAAEALASSRADDEAPPAETSRSRNNPNQPDR